MFQAIYYNNNINVSIIDTWNNKKNYCISYNINEYINE